jgi:multiple sugar transport system permease protein
VPATIPGATAAGATSARVPEPRRYTAARREERRAGMAMTLPFVALFAVFFVGPLVYSAVISLDAGGTGRFAGLLNYHYIASDAQFWGGVTRMLYFGAVQVTGMIGLAFALALVLDSVLRIPHLIGLASGAINPLDNRLALYSMMLIVTWEWTGYNMMILLTSLTTVPREIIEAAQVDGCSDLAIALRVKLPLIRRTVVFLILLSIIGTLQLFNEAVILNAIAGIGSTYTPNQMIYNTAFEFGNNSLAAAQSLVLAVITIAATAVFYSVTRRRRVSAAASQIPTAI